MPDLEHLQLAAVSSTVPGPWEQPGLHVEYPGRVLAVIGFVLAIFLWPLGLLLSIVAFARSRKAGYPNRLAVAGIIIGGSLTILAVVGVVVLVLFIAPYLDFTNLLELCEELGPGPHVLDDGVTIECT